MWEVWAYVFSVTIKFGEAFRKRPHLVTNVTTDQLYELISYVKYCDVL